MLRMVMQGRKPMAISTMKIYSRLARHFDNFSNDFLTIYGPAMSASSNESSSNNRRRNTKNSNKCSWCKKGFFVATGLAVGAGMLYSAKKADDTPKDKKRIK